MFDNYYIQILSHMSRNIEKSFSGNKSKMIFENKLWKMRNKRGTSFWNDILLYSSKYRPQM